MDRQEDSSDDRAATRAATPGWRRFLSHDSGPFAQFVKYGAIGVAATCVEKGLFFVLASTCLKCLKPDDCMVKWLGLPSAAFTGSEAWYASRGMIAAYATAVGFVFANLFCWLMNRWFVFRPGKFKWYAEMGMFFGVSSLATGIAIGIMKVLIDQMGMMVSLAAVVEVAVSFFVNFFIRKFFIFKG